jgi:hypothetical protein
MRCEVTSDVRVILPERALTLIFDECDQFERDETGGRVVGTFKQHHDELALHVTGIIESGPQADRSPVSFFQDGKHQERIFRQIEDRHPEIEHLGNWHTHHVNGLGTLSGGDVATYTRTVNHNKHNTSFFYALLVTAKHRTVDPLLRYSLRHYFFRRGEEQYYEVAPELIEIVKEPLVWPTATPSATNEHRQNSPNLRAQPGRVYDQDTLSQFYQGFRPYASEKLGFYWRGALELLDGSKVEMVVLESGGASKPRYSAVLREPAEVLKAVAKELDGIEFPSAHAALIAAERSCNRALYKHKGHAREPKPSR